MGEIHGIGNVDELIQANPDPIQLIDRTQNPDENSAGVWVKNVHIDSYSLIQGSSKAGAYVVWIVTIETVPHPGGQAGVITIRKRYSEFDKLRQQLKFAFPNRLHQIPELPPKSVVSKFRISFLESRRRGLEYFLLCILLNPVFSGSPIVKKFVRAK